MVWSTGWVEATIPSVYAFFVKRYLFVEDIYIYSLQRYNKEMNLNSRMCKKPIKVTQLIDEDRSSLQLLFVNLPQKMKRVLCQDAQPGTFLSM